MQDFKKLRVWQLSREFVSDIYKITANFPNHELHSMVNQLRRASYSIPSNIAEGCGKESQKEFKRYLSIVSGSIKECECFLILAKDLNYISEEQFNEINKKLEIIGKINYNLIKKINN
ncbi:MAG: four helix bundle protein [Peptostreptococcales bacterium]